MTARRKSIMRLALVAVALGGVSVTLAAMPIKEPAAGAIGWVQSLSQSDRSFYLEDSVLRSLPTEYRYALLNSIPRGQARATFWKSALTTFRDSHRLSPNQVTALDEAINTAEEVITGLDGASRPTEAYQKWFANLRSAFDPAAMNELLYKTSASDTGTVQLPISERLRYGWRRFRVSIGTDTGILALPKPDCNCNVTSDCGTLEGWTCDQEAPCNATQPPGPCGPGLGCEHYCVFIPTKQPKN